MLVADLPKRAFVKLQKDLTVSAALAKLKEARINVGLVFDQEKFLGLLSAQPLLRAHAPVMDMRIAAAIKPVSTISNEATILEAAYLMTNTDAFALPVQSAGKIEGVLHIFDLLDHLHDFKEIRDAKVSDLHLATPAPLGEESRISSALAQMHQLHTYALPIVDKRGLLTNLLTVEDFLSRLLPYPSMKEGRMSPKGRSGKPSSKGFTPNRSSPLDLPVSSLASNKSLVTATTKDNICDVVKVMNKQNTLCAVVQLDGRPLGLLTANNALRLLASLFKQNRLNITFTGLKKLGLDDFEAKQLQKVTSQQVRLIERLLHTDDLICHVTAKAYGKRGSRPKYSVHVNLIYPGARFATAEDDWDFNTAFRKAFNNIKSQINKRFREPNAR